MSTCEVSGNQVVLVLQGGGALGAYQAGVFQALHEHGMEPDWVIGTSIGAINSALIVGNQPAARLDRVREFWDRVSIRQPSLGAFHAFLYGVPHFFQPSASAFMGLHLPLGVDQAAFYTVDPLRKTLSDLIDVKCLNAGHPRLTVSAVNVRTGEMRYFDNRKTQLSLEHVIASSALPPAFSAVPIEGEYYWDGGLYSNTPIEAVLDDNPRRNSLIFAVNVWQPGGTLPESILQVAGRQKNIQYASRASSHIARQEQIHRLRHVIRGLTSRLSEEQLADPSVQEMTAYGCSTVMHLLNFVAPVLEGEDHAKDVDFSAEGIARRWDAGYRSAQAVLAEKPWANPVDPLQGMVIHTI